MNTSNQVQSSATVAAEAKLAVGEFAYLLPPLQYSVGDFGINLESPHPPHIYIRDSAGVIWLVPNVEWVLRNVDHFTNRDRDRMLLCAALNYGFDDIYILIRGRA